MWCCAVGCTSSAGRLPHPDFSWSADMNTFSAASLWEVPKRSLGEFCLVDSKRSPAGQPWALRQFQGHLACQGHHRPQTHKHIAPAACYMLVPQICTRLITSCFRQQDHAELQPVVPHAGAPRHRASNSRRASALRVQMKGCHWALQTELLTQSCNYNRARLLQPYAVHCCCCSAVH